MVGEAQEIVRFQIEVAEGWLREAEGEASPRFRFVGYFMAFNALYWLWGMLDGVVENEVSRIQALVDKLGADTARRILAEHDEYVRFLIGRGPVHRMDKRTRARTTGHPGAGNEYLRLLRLPAGEPTTRLKGLASILYLIRCNLVHGSKLPDEALPGQSVLPLRSIAQACLEHTRRNRP